jgi:hypothetical protein
MQYSIINEKTNVVVNIIVWDGKSQWQPPKGTYLVQSSVGQIGDFYDINKNTFTRPKLIGVEPVLENLKG